MNELTLDQIEAVFGNKLSNIDTSLQKVYNSVQGIIKAIDAVPSGLTKLQNSFEQLAQKLSESLKANKGKNIKINDILDKVSTSIAVSQKDNTEKLSSNFSDNFKSLNDQLKIVNDLSIESNREQLIALQRAFEQKIDNLTAVIQGNYATRKPDETKKIKNENTATELLLTQQLTVLEKLKASVDKKLTNVLDVITTTDKRIAADIKKEKLSPKEVSLSKKDRKMLQAIDASDEVVALTKEVKESKKLDSKSGIGKFLSPFLLLLGGIGALAFGVFKFPSIKRVFEGFTKTGFGSSMMSFFKSVTPRGMDMKEFVRSLPFIGRLVDLWDALDLMHKGNYKQGFKQLSFVIPGMEYLAVLLGTSKQRLLAKQYDKLGDKSFKLPFLGVSIEQVFQGAYDGVSTIFTPIIEFFQNAFGALGEGFNLIMKGASMNYSDIATTWDKIANDYFPVLRPVADAFKWLASSTFEWTAEKMKTPGYDTRTDKATPINIGDVINTLFKTIGDKLQQTFDYISSITSALGMVFSGNKSQQLKGLGILERQGLGGLADGISMFLNVIDSIKNMDSNKDGKIGPLELTGGVFGGISLESGPFSRSERRKAVFEDADKETYTSLQEDTKKMDQLIKAYTDLQKQAPIEEMDFMSRALLFKNARKGLPETKKQKEEWLQTILSQILQLDPSLRERASELARKSGQSIALPAYEETIPQLRKQETQKITEQKTDTEDVIEKAANAFYNMKQTAEDLTNTWRSVQVDQQEKLKINYGYRGYLEDTKEEIKKQTQATHEMRTYWDQTIRPLLVDIAMNGKKQNSHLEATSKGINAMNQGSRGNVVVNNSNHTNVTNEGMGAALAFKMQALRSQGMIPA